MADGLRVPRWTPLVAGSGLVLAGAYGARRMGRQWAAGKNALRSAGRSLPDDLAHHSVEVDDGAAIHVVERGTGPAVVLVHGVTLNVATWAPQLRSLGETHRVIAIDQRGHGQSVVTPQGDGEHPLQDADYSLERMAADLVAVLAALDVADALVVGHSMGGMVSLLAALRHRAEVARRVRGLLLVATSAGPLVPAALRPAAVALNEGAVGGLRRAERYGGLLSYQGVGGWIARLCFGVAPDPADVVLTQMMIAAMQPAIFARILGPLMAFDVHHELGALDLPAHVVVGSRDLLTPPPTARAIARAIPGASLTVLEGCGHMVMLERAAELDALCERFTATPRGSPPDAPPGLAERGASRR